MNALKIFLLQVLIIITCGYVVGQRYDQQKVDDSAYIQLRKPKQIIEKQNTHVSLETDEMNQNNLVYNEKTTPIYEVKDSYGNTVDYVQEIDRYGFPKRNPKTKQWTSVDVKQK